MVIFAALVTVGCAEVTTMQYASPEVPPPVGVSTPAPTVDDAYEDNDPSALEDFRPTLDPHGTWVDDSEYGTVWLPSPDEVGPDFVPYVSAGHWVYDTDYTWVSDYAWGWVPFHYGRWAVIGGRGWAWIPGRVYAGAWVVWRTGDADDLGFVGWAPMAPAWIWRNRFAVGIGFAPPEPFVFCGRDAIFTPRVSEHVVHGPVVHDLERRTRVYAPPAERGERGRAIEARPVVRSPPPPALGIDPTRVAHPTPQDDRGLGAARRYAVPSTARAVGARPPTPQTRPPGVSPSTPARPPTGVTELQPPSPPPAPVTRQTQPSRPPPPPWIPPASPAPAPQPARPAPAPAQPRAPPPAALPPAPRVSPQPAPRMPPQQAPPRPAPPMPAPPAPPPAPLPAPPMPAPHAPVPAPQHR
jgi:hypothetical protein